MSHADEILSALRKPVLVVSRELSVEYANPAFAGLVGLAAAPPLSQVGDAMHSAPGLAAVLARAVSKLRAAGSTTDARWSSAADDGRVFDIRVARMDGDRYAIVLDDVSHHLRVQEIQGRARSYLEAVLNQLPLGVIVLDAGFAVTFFNQAQGEIFARLGAERSIFDIIGAPVAESYPVFAADEWQGLHARVVSSGEAVIPSKVGYPRDQPARYLMITLVPLGPHADPASGAICVTDDVTRTVALERELLQKERLALVGQMAIALNHEINNPLTAIFGSAETLLYNGGLARDQVGRLETIRENSLRIVDVTRRLREIENIQLTEYVQGGPLMLNLEAVSGAASTSGSASLP